MPILHARFTIIVFIVVTALVGGSVAVSADFTLPTTSMELTADPVMGASGFSPSDNRLSEAFHALAAPAMQRASIGLDINYIYFGSVGMTTNLSLSTRNLRGEEVVVGVLYYWNSGLPMFADFDTPRSYMLDGQLAWADSFRPRYSDSAWNSIDAYVPYDYLPLVTSRRSAYVVAVAVVPGRSGEVYSQREYFTISP